MEIRPGRVIAVIVGVAFVLGCGGESPGERLPEKTMERMVQRSGVKDTKVDVEKGTVTFKGEQGRTEVSLSGEGWPKDLPAGIPQFTASKVKGVVRTGQGGKKSWTIILESLEGNPMASYAKALEDAGWSIVSRMETGEGGVVQASKGELLLVGIFNTAEGEGTLSVTEQ